MIHKPFAFTLEAIDGQARAGYIETSHGGIHTPMFMPVGTQATVKGLTREMIQETGAEIMLSNTYHLYLQPGHETVKHFGGLHTFMGVDIPILTDSGGFQVFSLGSELEKKALAKNTPSAVPLVKITEEGVHFRSHRDGSKHFFTPESVMEIQDALGADIIMAFDECSSGESSYEYAKDAMNRTHRWASRCVAHWKTLQKKRESEGLSAQALFAIIQGVIYDDLRIESCKYISELNTPGIAIGGLSVGEPKEDMYRILDVLAPLLPVDKPHYLMGVGTPEDLVEGIARGIDIMDCVLPTRLARHGVAFSQFGNCKITNAKYSLESGGIPVHPELETTVSRSYSLGYLRHLYQAEEMLAGQLVSMHNIEYLINIAKKSREAILSGTFSDFRKRFWSEMNVSN